MIEISDAVETSCHLDLPLSGMTCAACAARIEKVLNRLEGVKASVNFATEHARVKLNRDFPLALDSNGRHFHQCLKERRFV